MHRYRSGPHIQNIYIPKIENKLENITLSKAETQKKVMK